MSNIEPDLDLKLTPEAILKKLNMQPEARELFQEAERAAKELERVIGPSWALNHEVDLEDFEFTAYEEDFEVVQLSLAAATLGSELDVMSQFFRQKGEDRLFMMLNAGAGLLLASLTDHVTYMICREKYSNFRPTRRKIPGRGSVPLCELKTIADYLMVDKIGIQVTEDFHVLPGNSVLFFVEWATNRSTEEDVLRKCDPCGRADCELRK